MEIEAMSSSSERAPGVLDYARERLPPSLFAPAAVFLAAPALPAGWAFAKAVVVAAILVFQFRLWDDLNDREKDRVTHPERVLSRAENLEAFRALVVMLGVAVLLLLFSPRALAYVLAVGAFAVWYRWIAPSLPEVFRYHVVLLKYPLFSYLATGAPLASMALIYFTFVAHEALHDKKLAELPEVRGALAVEMFVWVALAIVVGADPSVPTLVAYLLPFAAALVAIAELRRFWKSDAALTGRAVFLVSLVSLVARHGAAS
jgi:hypothetical protein